MKLFKELLQTAKQTKQLKRSDLNPINVDTMVQEKAIAFLTDNRLYHKIREAYLWRWDYRGHGYA